jgi:hypothetical protein
MLDLGAQPGVVAIPVALLVVGQLTGMARAPSCGAFRSLHRGVFSSELVFPARIRLDMCNYRLWQEIIG